MKAKVERDWMNERRWRWTISGANGWTVAQSYTNFERRADAQRSVENFVSNIAAGGVEYE
jgi:uncharacterized protein YegP (UPF0339 family)